VDLSIWPHLSGSGAARAAQSAGHARDLGEPPARYVFIPLYGLPFCIWLILPLCLPGVKVKPQPAA